MSTAEMRSHDAPLVGAAPTDQGGFPLKVLPLDEVARVVARHRGDHQRVVLCHGTFDLMHTGHIRHLQRARTEGDVLVVTVTADAHVNKGPGRPVFSQELRAETLAALACVDYVAISHAPTSIEVINTLKPDVYVKGSDYRVEADDITGNITREREAVEHHGGALRFTDEITFSSTNLLNEHFGVFSEETKLYLNTIRAQYGAPGVIDAVKKLGRSRVLVVGDAIIDQYHYITPLGQTGKGNVLAVKYESEEQFCGGALAVANHVAGFAGEVTLVTGLGTVETHEAFIRSKLLPNVKPVFSYIENVPTVTKRRFVDPDLGKLFEVAFFDPDPVLNGVDADMARWLGAHAGEFDAVIVPDFGNGLISPEVVAALCDSSRFLAVNTQVNSGNKGHHVISRYRRADFIALNEPEIRLATHNPTDALGTLAARVGERAGARCVAVTRGSKGVLMRDQTTGENHRVPALSTRVVDRVGAGDAFLSLAGLCVSGGVPADLAAFVGGVAAALDVQIVCNREPVTATNLYRYVTTLLK